ncbi:MAG: crosslink repair DNA glycosylase YcaQ family protein [Nitriliruptoraceae bacterium]
MQTLTLPRARRLALTALGLARGRPPVGVRRDVRHLRRVLAAVGVVQLDSVNVLARAHELPFWSRLGPHDREARDRWLWRSRELFEGWIHVASLGPIAIWPWLHHRRAAHRPGPGTRALLQDDPHYLDRVLHEVAEHGPVSVQDLTDAGTRTGPWWGNPPGKIALDHLTASGRLAVHDRSRGFVTRYDLTERVVPPAIREREPPGEDRARELLLLEAVAAQGVGTVAHLADHHRQKTGPARAALARLVAAGKLAEARIAGWGEEPVYLDPEVVTARRARARTLISPFDPLVWHRERTERLFGFRYRIEIYVPEAQRVHGYYVLPFLLGDQLVGRVDLKADRTAGRLLVRGAFAEAGADRVVVARELAAELTELASWLALDEVAVEPNGDLAPSLARAVTAR